MPPKPKVTPKKGRQDSPASTQPQPPGARRSITAADRRSESPASTAPRSSSNFAADKAGKGKPNVDNTRSESPASTGSSVAQNTARKPIKGKPPDAEQRRSESPASTRTAPRSSSNVAADKAGRGKPNVENTKSESPASTGSTVAQNTAGKPTKGKPSDAEQMRSESPASRRLKGGSQATTAINNAANVSGRGKQATVVAGTRRNEPSPSNSKPVVTPGQNVESDAEDMEISFKVQVRKRESECIYVLVILLCHEIFISCFFQVNKEVSVVRLIGWQELSFVR
jgi:hypothetical protein